MKVVELTAYHVRIPLKKRIRHASHTRTESENLIVRCRLDSGEVGYGEGVPRDYVTGGTITTDLDVLRRSRLGDALSFSGSASFADAARAVESVPLAPVADDPRECKSNAAWCALELALLDALGRRFREPVSNVTKLLAPQLWQCRDRVQYSGAITSATGFKARLAAWAMRLYGFAHCKIKVGIEGQDDVKRLSIIRRRIGKAMDLRVDANEAWPAEQAAARIRELEPFGITSVEQPIAHEEVQALAEVRKQIQVPIMHDESLCSMIDARQAAADQTCDLFNLRLSKCGGFIRSLRLAQFAKEHGLGYQLGCQVGETAILSAAGRHFACSVRDIHYLEGSYDRRLVRESLATKDITFSYGGWASALAGPGLGIAIDEAALERVTVRKEVLLG